MDAVVIGGGVIGLSVAWRAARAGLAVAIVDPHPGRGASHVAAGLIAPAGEAHLGAEALLAAGCESAGSYPAFIRDLEAASQRTTGFRACGGLAVASGPDELADLERGYRHRVQLGLLIRRLTSRECRELEPGLAPGIRGGMRLDGDHQLDPRATCAALIAACQGAGVEIVRHSAAVLVEGGAVTGVTTHHGRTMRAERVVLAAGCWSAQVEGMPDEALPPVRPVKGQILRLRGDPGLMSRVLHGNGVYIAPRGDGRFVVGATVEERGFDTSVTAGAVHQLLRDARALVPDIAELELVEASAGLRPGSPDNAPIIGETTIRGLVVATGHHRNGFLLAPITADAVVAALRGAPWPAVVAPFSPLRFAARAEVAG